MSGEQEQRTSGRAGSNGQLSAVITAPDASELLVQLREFEGTAECGDARHLEQ